MRNYRWMSVVAALFVAAWAYVAFGIDPGTIGPSRTLESVSTGPATPTGIDTFTYLYAKDATAGTDHDSWPASYDVLNTKYKYMFIEKNVSDGDSAVVKYEANRVWARGKGADYSVNNSITANDKRFVFQRFGIDNIPANSTILNAKMCWISGGNADLSAGSVWCALDTNSADTAWYHAAACSTANANGDTNHASSSWIYANHDSSTAWGEDLNTRLDPWDFGIPGGLGLEGVNAVADDQATHDMTAALQLYVDRKGHHPNAGFVFSVFRPSELTVTMDAGYHATKVNEQPFLVVQWTNQKHQQPWFGYPHVMCVGTDDGLYAYNHALADTFDNHGYRHTMSVAKVHIAGTPSGEFARMTAAQIESLYNAGTDVQHHSTDHCAGGAVAACDDSLLGHMARSSIVAVQIEIDSLTSYLTLPNKNSWIFASPGGWSSILMHKMCRDEGFIGARDGTNALNNVNAYEGYISGSPTYMAWDDTTNLYSVKLYPRANVFGDDGDSFSDAEIQEGWRDAQAASFLNGRYAIFFNCHDGKDGAYGEYDDGIDPSEYDVLLDYIDARGVTAVKTYTQTWQWYRASKDHVWSDPPDTAQSYINEVRAADQLWMRKQ